MKYSLLILLFGLLGATSAGAQDCQKLAPSNAGSSLIASLLGEDAQSILGACQVSAGADRYSARVEYQGFSDKKYRIVGQLLDVNRRKVPGCAPVTLELEKGSSSVDLIFQFESGQQSNSEPHISVRYLKVTIADAADPLGNMDLGGITLTGITAEYRIDHQFRVGASSDGTSNVVVSVGFSPVKRAATIKQ